MNKRYSYLFPLVFATVMVFGIKLGYELNGLIGNKPALSSGMSTSKLDEVLRYIEVKYVDTVDVDKIVGGAIEEMLTELDPHSTYIPATDLQAVNESLDGNFDGIGIEFYIVRDTIIVVTPITGGPSEALGIQAGDRIIRVEDSTIAGVGIADMDVIKMLRGPSGSEVKVSIARHGHDELIDFNIVRGKVPLFSIDAGYMIDDTVGYIKINRFSASTYTEFMEQLRSLNDQGMRRLILDLRQNPGGYLTAATMIADEFIAGKELLVYTKGKAYGKDEHEAKEDGEFERGSLAIILDEGSASASEILAGAVQDLDRGLIVGRRSFGKGLVQEQYDLSDGSAVRLTIARYYTPTGRCIQKPYTDGEDAYRMELDHRYMSGELLSMDSIQLSDSLVYYTPKGRKVYGGGGIMPDVFVPLDTTYDVSYMSQVRMYIPQFSYTYFADHQLDLEGYKQSEYFKDNFEVTDELFQQFVDFAIAEGLDMDTARFEPLAPRIRTTIKAYFARQLWKEDGFYSVLNTMDPTVLATYEQIKTFNGFDRVKTTDTTDMVEPVVTEELEVDTTTAN